MTIATADLCTDTGLSRTLCFCSECRDVAELAELHREKARVMLAHLDERVRETRMLALEDAIKALHP